MPEDPMKEIKKTLENLARGDTDKMIARMSETLKKLKEQKTMDPKVMVIQKMLQNTIAMQKTTRAMLNKVVKNM